MFDSTNGVIVPYSMDKTFSAVLNIAKSSEDFKLNSIDNMNKIIYLKAGVSLISWGENIEISLKKAPNNATSIIINSQSKLGVSLGKNDENVRKLINSVHNELQKQVHNSENYCRDCGTQLNPNGKFCPQCGTKI